MGQGTDGHEHTRFSLYWKLTFRVHRGLMGSVKTEFAHYIVDHPPCHPQTSLTPKLPYVQVSRKKQSPELATL